MTRSTIDLWVGIFVVMGVIALGFLSLKVANLGSGGGGETYLVTGHFQNIGGLSVRAPVRSAGVTVGRVTGISLDREKYDALVTMEIEKKVVFPKDSNASILTSGILGENYIGIEPGGDEAMLKDGDNIKLTQSAVVLEKLISQFLFSKAQDGSSAPK
ncbi:MAG: outer membrane lipid asymmetry maintenance protein MlaD [Burkholderiales bacterium]